MKLITTLLLSFIINFGYSQVLDSTFTEDGVSPYGGLLSNSQSNKHVGTVLEFQIDEKLVVGTSNYYYNSNDNSTDSYNFYIYRYLPNGMPDLTFGIDGSAEYWAGKNSVCNDLKIQDDGKIVVIGETQYCTGGVCGANQFIMFRLLPNGVIDSTFGINGKIITEDIFGLNATYCIGYGLEIIDNGQFIIAGRADSNSPFIAKLNNDGSKDNSFGTNGIYLYNSCGDCTVKDLLVDDNGFPLILIENYTGWGESEVQLVRVNTLGIIDNTFGTNGYVIYTINDKTLPTSFDFMDSSIVIVGKIGNKSFCTKLNADGSFDVQFQTGTVILETQNDSSFVLNKVTVKDNNNIIVSGSIFNMSNGQFLHEGIVGLIDNNGNWSTNFNQSGYMHLDYGVQANVGWTGKHAKAYDVDINDSNEIFITGMRNHTPGDVSSSLLLIKLKNIIYNVHQDLSISKEMYNGNEIKVYPNPVSNRLYLSNNVNVKVYNLNGKIVLEGYSTSKLNTENLTPGVYILKTDKGSIVRFVKL